MSAILVICSSSVYTNVSNVFVSIGLPGICFSIAPYNGVFLKFLSSANVVAILKFKGFLLSFDMLLKILINALINPFAPFFWSLL